MEKEMSIEEMEWRAKRLGRFTASEIHKLFVSGRGKNGPLLGEGAVTYVATKMAEKLTMDAKEQGDFKQTQWGNENEADAAKAFQKIIGKPGTYYGGFNPQFFELGDHAGGSPDWLSLDGEDGADFKCPFNSSEHVKNLLLTCAADMENLHYGYYCQAQFITYMKNLKRFHFCSFDPRMVETKYRLKILTIYPDEAWVAEFKDRLEAAIGLLNEMEVKLSGAVLYSYDKQLETHLIQPV